MTYVDSIRGLLEAQEGEHTQFKEAKIGLILARRPNAVVPWQTMAAVNLFWHFR